MEYLGQFFSIENFFLTFIMGFLFLIMTFQWEKKKTTIHKFMSKFGCPNSKFKLKKSQTSHLKFQMLKKLLKVKKKIIEGEKYFFITGEFIFKPLFQLYQVRSQANLDKTKV